MRRLTDHLTAYCLLFALLCVSAACSHTRPPAHRRAADGPLNGNGRTVPQPVYASPVLAQLVAAAVERTNHQVQYDGSYQQIAYPNGDVAADRGACTDEVVRAYRAIGIDLQKEVHEDMQANFAAYPHRFGLSKPDANIDHRRVPNLMVFFARKGQQLPSTINPSDYTPGDIVTWDLGGGQTHIGIVVDVPSETDAARWQIMHNIGAGPQIQDALFAWQITGHYRYTGPPVNERTRPATTNQRRGADNEPRNHTK